VTMARRPTTADYLAAFRLDSEWRGGHRPSEVLAFVRALEDYADAERQAFLPPA
jgi:hypothetical protein